jgi:hypothetical protein
MTEPVYPIRLDAVRDRRIEYIGRINELLTEPDKNNPKQVKLFPQEERFSEETLIMSMSAVLRFCEGSTALYDIISKDEDYSGPVLLRIADNATGAEIVSQAYSNVIMAPIDCPIGLPNTSAQNLTTKDIKRQVEDSGADLVYITVCEISSAREEI